MPSSPNRRRIEIPVELHVWLTHEAQRLGLSASALATLLLTEALEERELPQPPLAPGAGVAAVVEELRESSHVQGQALRDIQRQLGELRDVVRFMPEHRPQGLLLEGELSRRAMEAERKAVVESLKRERKHGKSKTGEKESS